MRLIKGLLKLIIRTSAVLAFTVGFLVVYLAFNGNQATVLPDLPTFGTYSQAQKEQSTSYGPIIKLSRDDRPFCSAFVIDRNYALTAAHCIDGTFGEMDGRPLQILDEVSNDTGVIAHPVGKNNRVDIGLVMGDFSEFVPYRVDFYGFTPTNNAGQYVTCGFPYLQNKVTCNAFIPSGNVGFSLVGAGFLIPGMSGGPVIDTVNGVVIGINSAMGMSGGAYIAPVLGALGFFGIEP